VTSWEVWFGEPKADNIVSLGVGRYTHAHTLAEIGESNTKIIWPSITAHTAEQQNRRQPKHHKNRGDHQVNTRNQFQKHMYSTQKSSNQNTQTKSTFNKKLPRGSLLKHKEIYRKSQPWLTGDDCRKLRLRPPNFAPIGNHQRDDFLPSRRKSL
jgi:hypothetical protein